MQKLRTGTEPSPLGPPKGAVRMEGSREGGRERNEISLCGTLSQAKKAGL